jgi:hypothetical protein
MTSLSRWIENSTKKRSVNSCSAPNCKREILLHLSEVVFRLSIRQTENCARIALSENVRRSIRVAVDCDRSCERVRRGCLVTALTSKVADAERSAHDQSEKMSHSFLAGQALRFVRCQSIRQHPQLTPTDLANAHRVPCGHEQNTPTMPRRRLFGSLGAKRCPSSGRARRGRGR